MSKHVRVQVSVSLMSGSLLLAMALGLQTVTVAGENYTGILLTALALTAVADLCFVFALIRGRLVARVLSVLLLLPTVFVLWDFIRRSGSAF